METLALWRIEGESFSDSGGGDMRVHAITPSPTIPPDPNRALEIANRRHHWGRIDSITLVAEFPAAWDDNYWDFDTLAERLVTFAEARPSYPHVSKA